MASVLATFAKGLKQTMKPAAWLLLGSGLGVALCIGLQRVPPFHTTEPAASPQDERQPIELADDLRLSGSPALGSASAPITIVEFSDFECPYCKRFHERVLTPLREQYISKGLVRFVHKDLPLPFHAQADLSARVARCSPTDADYWEIYQRLFDRQTCLSCEGPIQIATDDPTEQDQLRTCADDPATALLVNTDRSEAELHGIRATPTLVIGPTISAERHRGRVLEGAMPWPTFKRILDAELEASGHRIDTTADAR
jgi:protein-disulfide isomerase